MAIIRRYDEGWDKKFESKTLLWVDDSFTGILIANKYISYGIRLSRI
jgi:hypothetical protein